MKTIFFPYTVIDRSTLNRINAAFGPVAILQPAKWSIPEEYSQETQHIEILTFSNDDDHDLSRQLAEYLTWGRMHEDDDIPFIKTRLGTTPFFEDGSSLRIRSDIRKNIPGTPPNMAPETLQQTLLRNARLFLSMAQLMDLDARAVAQEVKRIGQLESSLFDSLKGEAPGPTADSPELPKPDAPSDYMLDARMTAWTRVFFHQQAAEGNPPSASTQPTVFVTINRAVIAYLLAQVPDGKQLKDLPPEYAGTQATDFDFFRFPRSPDALFQKCTGVSQRTGVNRPQTMSSEAPDIPGHTIVALPR